jgi:hypothetical protein
MVVLLNGRARHQIITISNAGASNRKSVSWACKSQSLTGRLHCHQGTRYFTIEPADPETAH